MSLYPSINTMQRRFRRLLSAVKENCSVGYAKIVAAGGFSDVDLIIIKATAPNDSPLSEKYVHELLKIFAFSPPSYRAFSRSFSRRFRKTRCWRVGLKCLLLLHRLLQSVPENSEFRFELLRSRSNGSISLHQRRIRDDEDYASFIRSYARLLDEAMNCDLFCNTNAPSDSSRDEAAGTISSRINEINREIEISRQMQNLIDRVIDCRPRGRAAGSIAVQLAMKHIIRESFLCYRTIYKDIDSIEDSFLQLPYRSCVAAIRIYKKAAAQVDQLSELYDWCKVIGVRGLCEFPVTDRITESRIEALEASIGKMWEMTESSSSSTTSRTSKSSPLDCPALEMQRSVVVSSEWETFEGSDFGVKPLIEVEVEEEEAESNWEDLLEASASFTWNPLSWEQNVGGINGESYHGKLELYNTSINPFHHWIQA